MNLLASSSLRYLWHRSRVGNVIIIPDQFTVKVHPALFDGEGRGGGGAKKTNNYYSSL